MSFLFGFDHQCLLVIKFEYSDKPWEWEDKSYCCSHVQSVGKYTGCNMRNLTFALILELGILIRKSKITSPLPLYGFGCLCFFAFLLVNLVVHAELSNVIHRHLLKLYRHTCNAKVVNNWDFMVPGLRGKGHVLCVGLWWNLLILDRLGMDQPVCFFSCFKFHRIERRKISAQ